MLTNVKSALSSFLTKDRGYYRSLILDFIVSATRRRRDITIMTVNPRMGKFNMVSNNYGRKHKCDFSVFNRKHPFWANLVKKSHNCQFKLKFGP